MIYIILWWLIIQFLGWLALPVAFRIFRWLPDRGYAFSKALGLLMVSYLLWLGSITGFLHDSRGGLALGILIVAGLSGWLYYRYLRPGSGDEPSLLDFLREHKGMIITVEILFTVGFLVWAILRAYASFKIDPAGGEKFMEIAFLNAILRSVHFPPLDPWLSGFSISYYYFGYVMMAAMTRLSGAPVGIAFDLYDALLFALTLIGAFGVVYNLIPAARRPRPAQPSFGHGQPIRYALLGALLLVIMGNLSGFFESAYATGLVPDSFWKWLNQPDLISEAQQTGTLNPSAQGWFWWWRGSRVTWDRDLNGKDTGYNITEFPFFSFLLGDNHPHVLDLPFVLLAIGLALNLLRRQIARGETGGSAQSPPWWNPIAFCLDGDAFLFVMTAFCVGALGFLNTWDLPIYLGLITLAYGLGLYATRPPGTARRLDWPLVRRALVLLLGMGLLSGLIYILFYLGFSSQAAGVLPYVFPPTQLRQYFYMFGPFLVILTAFMAVYFIRRARQAGSQWALKTLLAWLLTAAGLLAVYALVLLGLSLLDLILHLTNNPVLSKALSGLSASAALVKAIGWRLRDPWLLLWLTGLISLAVACAAGHVRAAAAPSSAGESAGDGAAQEDQERFMPPERAGGPGRRSSARPERVSPSVLFVLLLIFMAFALTLSVEFIFLRDAFGTRMNTVFKFYYQGWVMMACASAYAVWWMLNRGDKVISAVGSYTFLGAAMFMVGLGLFYPVLAYSNRVQGFVGKDGSGKLIQPNIDGTSSLQQRSPDDWAAIRWLDDNVTGVAVILEAPGGSYTYNGRMSALTGLPAVLGWAGHESQWRGNYNEQGKREPDIAQIYTSRDSAVTLGLLHKWGVQFVIVGDTERAYIRDLCSKPDYGCNAASAVRKFDGLLPKVFDGATAIYAVP